MDLLTVLRRYDVGNTLTEVDGAKRSLEHEPTIASLFYSTDHRILQRGITTNHVTGKASYGCVV